MIIIININILLLLLINIELKLRLVYVLVVKPVVATEMPRRDSVFSGSPAGVTAFPGQPGIQTSSNISILHRLTTYIQLYISTLSHLNMVLDSIERSLVLLWTDNFILYRFNKTCFWGIFCIFIWSMRLYSLVLIRIINHENYGHKWNLNSSFYTTAFTFFKYNL